MVMTVASVVGDARWSKLLDSSSLASTLTCARATPSLGVEPTQELEGNVERGYFFQGEQGFSVLHDVINIILFDPSGWLSLPSSTVPNELC